MTATSVPLKHLVAINERSLPDDTDPAREIRCVDISSVGQGTLVSEPQVMTFRDAPSRARRLVRPGDTIVSTVRTYLRAVWPVPPDVGDLVVSTGFAVLTPRRIDGRYLSWWVRGSTFIEEVVARSAGVSYPAINPLDLGALPVRVVSRDQQVAIAEFLDAETARIDALIAKKRRMVDLLAERRSSLRTGAFRYRAGWRLKRVLRAPMAYGVLVPRFVDPESGTPMIRIGALDLNGSIAADRMVFIDPAQDTEYKRTRVEAGDLVLSVVGSMGRSAVVDGSAAGANLNRPLARLRPDHALPTRLLWHWTQTVQFLDQARLSTGGDTAQPTLNLGDLAEFEIGLPADLARWQGVLEDIDRRLVPLDSAAIAVDRQIALLQEHRQALITAAVTGELEIPVVAA